MSNEQHVYDKNYNNNIVIVPTVGLKKDEPPAKKPKLDSTPEKEATETCGIKARPDQASTPKKDEPKNADSSCVKKEVKVNSWASSYLQSIGQQAGPTMTLTKNTMVIRQPSAPVTQRNIANTSNWAPMNLPSQYLYPNPLSYNFQRQTSINPTQSAFCSAPSLNYNMPVNYITQVNYTAPVNYAVPTNYSAPQNYSAPINYTNSLNYTAPVNYLTPTNETAPISYNAPLNYTAPINDVATNYTAPLNYEYTTPSTESIMIINDSITSPKEPGTPLFDEPFSPLSSDLTMPLNDSLQCEPISPVSEFNTPTKLDDTKKTDTQLANSAPEHKRLSNNLKKIERTTTKTNIPTKNEIKLSLIKKKTDKNTKSNSIFFVYEQNDDRKTRNRIRGDKYIQLDKHTKRSESTSGSREKVVNTHESRSPKPASKRTFIEPYTSVKETSKTDYTRKGDRQKKQSSEHHKYHESESHKKSDTKEHTKYDNHKTKINDKIEEIRSLYEKTRDKKSNSVKPSTSKIRRSRTPESVQRKRQRTDLGNADRNRSTKNTTPVKSVVQPINKIKYPTSGPKYHSPERNETEVPEHYDLRSKLSRANRYFQKNQHSQNHLKDLDNLVVTINQEEGKIEPKPKSPPKVTVTEKKIKSKNKKYKTIKFTIKVLCQDGEGSGSSHSDDSEEEVNTRELASPQNDLSFLDDFNVDEIVDSLNNSQKHSANIQNQTQPTHTKERVSKNNKPNDRLAVPEPSNDDDIQIIQVNESNDCIIVEDTIKTENIKSEQKYYDSNINESSDCLILDTVEIDKVKTERGNVFDVNNDSNDCVMLNASSITNIKTEQDIINETYESCMILDNALDIISIKSEPNDSVGDIKPNIEIKSEILEKTNDCIVVEIDNHPIKLEDSFNYMKSDDTEVIDNSEAQDIKMEMDNITNGNENIANVNGSDTIKINENHLLHDEDTMEIPQLAEDLIQVYETENTQGVDVNITGDNCQPVTNSVATFKLIDVIPKHGEFEIPIIDNKATETVTEDIKQDLSKINSDAIIKIEETPNITKMEQTAISPVTDNVANVGIIHNQETNQHVPETETNTEIDKVIEIPVIEETLTIEPIKKEPLIEIVPTKNFEMNDNKASPESKTANEKKTPTKPKSPKKADAEKHEKVNNNIEVVSKNLETVSLKKENIAPPDNESNESKKKREPPIYVCEPEGLTIAKAIKQEIIDNIEPELSHLKPKDSQAIINAVAAKAGEIINTVKPENSKDTSKVPSPVATKTIETEKRQVAIVKKQEGGELGEIKQQLESRMFEYLQERYTVTSLIHEGRYAKVFKCNDSKERNFAVKLLKNSTDRIPLGLEKEAILRKIQKDIPKENLNIVMVIDGFGFERRWALLMEFYPNDLETLLQRSKKGFSLDELPGLARQLIMAVMVLRNNQIVHSDIKPSHILLDESRQRLKLCGFDNCYYANTTEIMPNIGTLSYRAPEIIMGFSANFSIDVWSAGTVLYEMFTKRKLFLGFFNNQVLFNQLCIFGNMPLDMIQMSMFRSNHFAGLSFVRRIGGGMRSQLVHKFFKTQRLYNLMLSSYYFFWGKSNKPSLREDLSKLYCFYELLEKMLVLDPRRRLPIEFVCADPFIKEY